MYGDIHEYPKVPVEIRLGEVCTGQNMSKTYSVKAPVSSRLTHPLIKGVIKFSRIMRQCVWGAFLTGRDTEDFPLEQSHDDTLLSAFEPSDEN